MIIIDNSCLSYSLNVDNGVPILPYYDSERDEELKHLTYYLNCLVEQGVDDVRVHNREAFGLMKLKEGDPDVRERYMDKGSE
jgi:TFIIF-interacting CTD phosphatase-like protein